MGLGLDRAGRAPGVRRSAAVALLGAAVIACQSPVVTPSPSPTPSAVVASSPTALPATPAPTPAATTRHVNEVLGFSVALPAPWRRSECLSGVTREGPYLGQDVLTWRTAAEEHDLGGAADTGGSGALTWVITINVQTSSQTPAEYARAQGGSVGDTTQALTIDGRPAIRVNGGLGGTSIYVANAGRMYVLSLRTSYEPAPRTTDAAVTFDAIAGSLTFVPPVARPTPTPSPVLSPAVETLVDAVTAAFAARDADRLRELMPPTCWFSSAGYASSGTLVSREKMAERIRSSFAQGLTVAVEPRPILMDAAFVRGPFWVWSTWSAYGSAPVTPKGSTQLVFDQVDGRWYWIGALFNADALRRP